MDYKPTIGLEIHAELKTRTKMFCDSLSAGGGSAFGGNDSIEKHPNHNVCPVCLGHPGTLPTINKKAVEFVIRVGLALGGKINPVTKFDRKNYFYPDLPKGYQISQYDQPLVVGGELNGIRIRRVHLEEDTGTLVHLANAPQIIPNDSRIDTPRIILKDESHDLMKLLSEIHNKLGPIYKEKNYQDAIKEILKRERIPYEREKKIELKLENLNISDFFADFVVDGKILIEVKAKRFITNDDLWQASRYIKSLNLPLAIVVNFKRQSLEYKRVINPAFENSSGESDVFGNNSGKFGDNSRGSLVDFNRAGVPLMELVTEPDFGSADEVVAFAKELQLILRHLGVSDADMERGQMRIEANVSLAQMANGEWQMGTKTELKNINSFRFAKDAIDYEIKRQIEVLKNGEEIKQETRGWNEAKKQTVSQRSKEEAHDYRYFPEPDLPPFETKIFEPEKLKDSLPELPAQKRARFVKEYGFNESQAGVLVDAPALANYFEEAASELKSEIPTADYKLLLNYLTSDLAGLMNKNGVGFPAGGGSASGGDDLKIDPEHLARLVLLIERGKIGSRQAKDVLAKMFETGMDPEDIVKSEGLETVSDTGELEAVVKEVIEKNPKAVEDYKKGKAASMQFLVGQAMSRLKGRGNPTMLKEIFERVLK